MKGLYISLCLALVLSIAGCRKDENIDFKFNNELDYVPTELDHWLSKLFTDPYNMEVVYRFDRYKMGELKPNLVPAKEEKVKEQMEMILNGFILPFEKAGGIPFTKTFLPKEWVLSGSMNIASDGSRILAFANGGRNITLYEVNTTDTSNANTTRMKLKTVHHEFSHSLTQLIRIPRDFESISEANYSASWSNSTVWPDAINNEQGFVSRYARSSVMEDFAETVGFLLVEGQLWYNTKAASMPKSGYDNMKAKEAAVVKFYRDSYDVDFRKLQREMAYAMHKHFNDTQKQSFPYWFFDQQTFNRNLPLSTSSYGSEFAKALQDFRDGVGTIKSVFGKWTINDMSFVFTPLFLPSNPVLSTSGDLVVKVVAKEGSFPTLKNIDFTFSYKIDPATQKISFTKLTQNTGSPNWDLGYLMPHFLSSISKYMSNTTFGMDWSLANPSLSHRDEFFFNSGGFYKENDKSDYINFQLKEIVK